MILLRMYVRYELRIRSTTFSLERLSAGRCDLPTRKVSNGEGIIPQYGFLPTGGTLAGRRALTVNSPNNANAGGAKGEDDATERA